jgi:hypothetical protein
MSGDFHVSSILTITTMQVILNNGKETIDFTSIILKQMSGELTREQVQELINKARNTK